MRSNQASGASEAEQLFDPERAGDFHFAHQKAGTTPSDLRSLAAWLVAQEVEQVVAESTAQY